MRIFVPFAVLAALTVSGCMPENGIGGLFEGAPDGPEVTEAGADTPRPEARPDGAETSAPLSAMVRPSSQEAAPGAFLGAEQASLGDPAAPGLWLATRHVAEPAAGRVALPGGGPSVAVELRPSGGAGGRLSLAALQALGLPLTALAEVEVFAAR